jgi:methionine-rich copper-binding protein CopC
MTVAIVASVTLLSWSTPMANAHAFPVAEDPRVGSTVSSAPAQVAIQFDSPIESLFATLDVSECGWKQPGRRQAHCQCGCPQLVGAHQAT